ncbi:MAG TPA: hypothetical protein VL944_02390 [Candidatus Acidoferrum sp.]|nr:hypothetical protein [Candidatus Acidoferrum sp.]
MCGEMYNMRNFLTREEKLEILTEYKKNLEQETKGIAERIEELKKKNN